MKKILLAAFASFFLFAPSAYAQANLPLFNPDFTIVPEQCTSCPCNFGGTMQLAQNLMNAGIAAGILIMILVVIYAGALFLFSPTNPGNREMGKSMFTNAIIGFIIVIAAWLIVDFIMKSLYDSDATWGPWNQIITTDGSTEWCIKSVETQPLFGGKLDELDQGDEIGTTDPGETDGRGSPGDESGVRSALTAAGISVSRDACTATKTTGCTNVGGLRAASIDQAIEIKKACGCSVTITGGSEGGHAAGTYSHANGYKVDYRLDGPLNSFFESLKRVSTRSGDPVYNDKCGNEYVKESDHWDVTTFRVCTAMK